MYVDGISTEGLRKRGARRLQALYKTTGKRLLDILIVVAAGPFALIVGFLMDLKILLTTVRAVVRATGR